MASYSLGLVVSALLLRNYQLWQLPILLTPPFLSHFVSFCLNSKWALSAKGNPVLTIALSTVMAGSRCCSPKIANLQRYSITKFFYPPFFCIKKPSNSLTFIAGAWLHKQETVPQALSAGNHAGRMTMWQWQWVVFPRFQSSVFDNKFQDEE